MSVAIYSCLCSLTSQPVHALNDRTVGICLATSHPWVVSTGWGLDGDVRICAGSVLGGISHNVSLLKFCFLYGWPLTFQGAVFWLCRVLVCGPAHSIL